LDAYLQANGIIGLTGVDTRAVTRRIRKHGSLRAVISTEDLDDASLCEQARALPAMAGQNLAARVAGQAPENWQAAPDAECKYRIVALDCGIKFNILRSLTRLGCEIVSMSGLSSPEEVLERQPHGILVGNGPGDPSVVDESITTVRSLIGELPMFGICLGHQLIACALHANIYKLKFGHHGINHPVRNLATGQIEITSQNHGFAVDKVSLARVGAVATHTNLNDHSLEGFAHKTQLLFAVQYHPEAAPGPHDAEYLFKLFVGMIQNGTVPPELLPA
jgi:carbamoyl-phosphate synthase small subunit